jgi:YD repeat-containing protein
MGDKKRITYKYDADGDVISSSRDGVYLYDARKRLVSGRKLKLEWDDRDRLIRSTVGDISYTYTYECR